MGDWDIQLRGNLFLFLLWETPSSVADCVFCVCEHICIIDARIPSESLECIDTVFGGNRSVFGVYFWEEDCLPGSYYGILFGLTAESFVKLTLAALEIAAARGGHGSIANLEDLLELHNTSTDIFSSNIYWLCCWYYLRGLSPERQLRRRKIPSELLELKLNISKICSVSGWLTNGKVSFRI